MKRAKFPNRVASMIVSRSTRNKYELPIPCALYFFSRKSATEGLIIWPTYSITISSAAIGSSANRPQSWMRLRAKRSCFFRN